MGFERDWVLLIMLGGAIGSIYYCTFSIRFVVLRFALLMTM